MLKDRLGVSERRACLIAGQHRSTQRRDPCVAGDDGPLRAALRKLSREWPRWGYRRAHAQLLEAGWSLNRKRTQRLWREEGLRVPQRRRKRQRLGESTVPASRLRAERPDQVWALDFQYDQTADGRILKLLHVVDEFTREALEMKCERRIDADSTVVTLDGLVALRGRAPEFIRCDNGPELTANALRDWCRFSHTGSAYIEPGIFIPWGSETRFWLGEQGRRVTNAPVACRASVGERGHTTIALQPYPSDVDRNIENAWELATEWDMTTTGPASGRGSIGTSQRTRIRFGRPFTIEVASRCRQPVKQPRPLDGHRPRHHHTGALARSTVSTMN